MALKLSKLPKRTPIKISIVLNPETHEAMVDYARIYEEVYGSKESIEELIPYMIKGFLNNDHVFKKARRQILKPQKLN
uniref:Transposase n=1 Tax=OCS116 cluster bacterium TaxID=2030921 RepID=A0A2A4Z731_9PROT